MSKKYLLLWVLAALYISPAIGFADDSPTDSPEARRERALDPTIPVTGHIHADAVQATKSRLTTGDPLMICVQEMAADPKFAGIATKLPLAYPNHATFEMLADETYPTPKERKEIAAWFDEREDCWKSSESLHREKWPPELFQLAKEGGDEAQIIGVQLYNRKITFGAANKQIQDLQNRTAARAGEIVKRYQADIAQQKADAQKKADEEHREADLRRQAVEQRDVQEQEYADARTAQAEALRLQRAQLFLNYIHAMQPQPIRVAPIPQTRTTNCYTYGRNTNCTTN